MYTYFLNVKHSNLEMRSDGSQSANTNKHIITGVSLEATLDVLFN